MFQLVFEKISCVKENVEPKRLFKVEDNCLKWRLIIPELGKKNQRRISLANCYGKKV